MLYDLVEAIGSFELIQAQWTKLQQYSDLVEYCFLLILFLNCIVRSIIRSDQTIYTIYVLYYHFLSLFSTIFSK